jgi:hypothetical protein
LDEQGLLVRVTSSGLNHKEDYTGENEVPVLVTFQQKIIVPVNSRCQLLYGCMAVWLYGCMAVSVLVLVLAYPKLHWLKVALVEILSDFALLVYFIAQA